MSAGGTDLTAAADPGIPDDSESAGTHCKCAKAGRRCNSSCGCSRFSMCTNMEAMEALDKAILERSELDEVNVALTRSEIA